MGKAPPGVGGQTNRGGTDVEEEDEEEKEGRETQEPGEEGLEIRVGASPSLPPSKS